MTRTVFLRSCGVAALAVAAVVRLHGQGATAITGATLIDGTARAPIEDAVVIIEGGRIRAAGPRASTTVPAGATVIDARGKFVIPGLADMHNHLQTGDLTSRPNLRLTLSRLLALGVTTVFNPSIGLNDHTALKAAAAQETAALPRFFSSGPMVSVRGDFMAAQVGAPTPDTPEAAVATIGTLKAAGVDAIKVQRDDFSWGTTRTAPIMKPDVLAAIVKEAHQQNLRVFAHAPLLDYAKDVLRAGGDGLMHGIIDKPVDREFLDLMTKNRASYVSTAALYEDVADVSAWVRRQSQADRGGFLAPAIYDLLASPAAAQQFQGLFNNTAFTKERLPVARANLKAVQDAGIPVVMGTDSGFIGVMTGVASHLELALLVEAGLTPADAIRAATLNAARMIGQEKVLGSVEAGKAADMVILDASPLADIRNTTRIYRVVKGGVVHDPAALLK